MLTVVIDPTSWIDLRTYNGRVYDSFIDAARARHLLEDEDIWYQTAMEAFQHMKRISQRMRWLAVFFATVRLRSPEILLYKLIMTSTELLLDTSVARKSNQEKKEYVLRSLEWFLRAHGILPDVYDYGEFETACQHVGLPAPQQVPEFNERSYLDVIFGSFMNFFVLMISVGVLPWQLFGRRIR